MECLNRELANKLMLLQFLVNMSFNYEHKIILDAYKEIHNAWQMRELEWTDDWSVFDERLKAIKSCHQYIPQKHTFMKALPFPGFGKQQSLGFSGAGSADNPQGKPDINGVPKTYMDSVSICIRFNGKFGCPEKQSHKKKSDEKTTLQHICGGCFKKSSTKSAHRAFDCQQGPFGPLFQ